MSIRYLDFTTTELRTALRELTEGQLEGVVSISHNGNSTTFYGAADIEAQIQRVEVELLRRARAAVGATKTSPMQPQNPIMTKGV